MKDNDKESHKIDIRDEFDKLVTIFGVTHIYAVIKSFENRDFDWLKEFNRQSMNLSLFTYYILRNLGDENLSKLKNYDADTLFHCLR